MQVITTDHSNPFVQNWPAETSIEHEECFTLIQLNGQKTRLNVKKVKRRVKLSFETLRKENVLWKSLFHFQRKIHVMLSAGNWCSFFLPFFSQDFKLIFSHKKTSWEKSLKTCRTITPNQNKYKKILFSFLSQYRWEPGRPELNLKFCNFFPPKKRWKSKGKTNQKFLLKTSGKGLVSEGVVPKSLMRDDLRINCLGIDNMPNRAAKKSLKRR